MRAVASAGIVVLWVTAGASAAGLFVVDRTIEAAPGQEVPIVAGGVGPIGGVELYVQVGDGGDLAGGTDVAGVDAARITTIMFPHRPPGIWPPPEILPNGLIALASYVTPQPVYLPLDPIALLILDGTGLVPGQQFPVALEISAFGAQSSFAGEPADPLIPGVITVIPEPAVALMLVLGSALVVRRRRR